MNEEYFKLIANPNKFKIHKYSNVINSDNLLKELQIKFNNYDINNIIYNKIIKKIENILIENTVEIIILDIINKIDEF